MAVSGKVLQCFINVDLRSGHAGLGTLARKHKVDVSQLGAGEFLVFINPRQDKMKVYAANQVLCYIRADKGRLDLGTIQYLPAIFKAKGTIDYDAAMKLRIQKAMEKRDTTVQDMEAFSSPGP